MSEQNKKWDMSLNETKQQQKKSALVKIISDICTNVVHYRASGILLITMQLYLFNFFARFECVFHANKNILWFISLKSFVSLSFKHWNCNSFTHLSFSKNISSFNGNGANGASSSNTSNITSFNAAAAAFDKNQL